jgi:hypothetical protein
MSGNTGLLIRFDEARRSDLILMRAEDSGEYQTFSDALSVPDWGFKDTEIALLSFSGDTIDFMALARKGKRVATAKNRVEFSHLLSLDAIEVGKVEARLKTSVKQYFVRSSQGNGGRMPPGTWAALIQAVVDERPLLASEIENVMRLRLLSGKTLEGQASELLLQERDALGTTLDIFFHGSRQDLRKRVLGNWTPATQDIQIPENESSATTYTGNSLFINSIMRLNEETTIQHDLLNWPGMSQTHQFGITNFRSGDRRLDVVYANRNSLETTLGIDLIYFNEIYQLFVLVQYKLMKRERDGGDFIYRPDEQLRHELNRMDAFYETVKASQVMQSHEDFRLSDDGFFVKLVPNKGVQVGVGDLISGMYLPRQYVHFLLGEKGPKGPLGGTQITFQNAKRYMNNSDFIQSINAGWIGTRGIQSVVVRDLIRQHYETGRAVMVAHETAKPKPQSDGATTDSLFG